MGLMSKKRLFVISIFVALVCLYPSLVICQEEPSEKEPAVTQETAPAAEKPVAAPVAKDLSLYGEVQAVNAATNTITVLYYDETSYEEKSMDLVLNVNTRLENATLITDINAGDWVDVTYTVADGKNMARTIMKEKDEEPVAEEAAPSATATEAE